MQWGGFDVLALCQEWGDFWHFGREMVAGGSDGARGHAGERKMSYGMTGLLEGVMPERGKRCMA